MYMYIHVHDNPTNTQSSYTAVYIIVTYTHYTCTGGACIIISTCMVTGEYLHRIPISFYTFCL